MLGQARQRDPDVAADKLLAGRPGGGVVVDAGTSTQGP